MRPDIPDIPNKRGHALSRFYGLERRRSKPTMQSVANKFEKKVEALISSGTVVSVSQTLVNELVGMVWYLPALFYVE